MGPRTTALAGLMLTVAGLAPTIAINYFKGINTITDLETTGILDKNGVVSKATLLSFSNPTCEDDLRALGFPQDYFDLPDAVYETAQVQFKAKDSNELVKLFGVKSCDTFVYLPARGTLQDFDKTVGPDSSAALSQWFWSKTRAYKLPVTNDLSFPVIITWEDRGGMATHGGSKDKHVMTLLSGKSDTVDSYLGHTFIFRDQHQAFLARRVITDLSPVLLSKLVYACDNDDCEKSDTEVLQRTEEEAALWKGRRSANLQRLRQCENQPKQYKRYTPSGFHKTTFPKDAWQVVQKFWQDNKHVQIYEPWSRDDTHVNFWSSHTTMAYISEDVRQLIFSTLQPILESWSKTPLDPTSSYGIRSYHNGSWLRDHADKGDTHIVSAILNIDQDVDEPWPLHILDHEGNRHQVVMQPGDLVLYESAVAIHGRPMPFRGKLFAGIFTHFRPLAWQGRTVDGDIGEEEGPTQVE